MIPLYILGLLQRFGPQHGYQIKKIISEQLADFTQIKLPVIYYHLEKMQKEGLLCANNKKDNLYPEKTIYKVTDKGIAEFRERLNKQLAFNYRPIFETDALFYFSDSVCAENLIGSVTQYIAKLTHIINLLDIHKKETLNMVPDQMKPMVNIIFSHHAHHYKAELDWAGETFKTLTRGEEH